MDDDEQICVDDYPEHDYVLMDDRDGSRTYRCRRCDAETWVDDDSDASPRQRLSTEGEDR